MEPKVDQSHRYFRNIYIFLVTLAIVVPAFLYSTFTLAGDFTTAFKYFGLLSIALLGVLAICIQSLFKGSKPEPATAVSIQELLIIGWVVFTILNALSKGVPVSNRDEIKLSAGVIIFFLSLAAFGGKTGGKGKEVFLTALCLSGALQASIGFLQLTKVINSLNPNYFPITGTFRNPEPFALYLGSIFPFALATVVSRRSARYLKILCGITALLIIAILAFTLIRASWLMVIVSTVIIVFTNNRSKMRRSYSQVRKFAVAVIVLTSAFALSIGFYRLKPLSTAGRVLIWKVSLQAFRNEPVFGYGPSSFQRHYGEWQNAYFQSDTSRITSTDLKSQASEAYLANNVETAYNEYIEVALDSGIIGLSLFVAAIVSVIFLVIRVDHGSSDSFVIASIAAFAGVLCSSFFTYPLRSIPTFAIFFFLLGFLTSHVSNHFYTNRPIIKNAIARVSAIILFLYLVRLPGYSKWESAKLAAIEGNEEKATQYYEAAYSSLCSDPRFLIDYAGFLFQAANYEREESVLGQAKGLSSNPEIYILYGQLYEQVGKFDSSAIALKFAHFELPNLLYPCYLLAKLSARENDTGAAIFYASKVIRTGSKIQSISSDKIIFDMARLLAQYQGKNATIPPKPKSTKDEL